MSYILNRWGYLRVWETPPESRENPSDSTAVPGSESGGSPPESGVFSPDDFNRFRDSVNERFDQIGQRFDGFGQQIAEGFEWVRENLPSTSLAGDGGQGSPSENPPEAETIIEVEDRQTPPRNRKPRARLNLGNLFR